MLVRPADFTTGVQNVAGVKARYIIGMRQQRLEQHAIIARLLQRPEILCCLRPAFCRDVSG